MSTELILLLVLLAAAGWWLDVLRQREWALMEAQRLCSSHGVQLLDHSVGLVALRLRRHQGRLVLERHYGFEVSVDGNDRQRGRLWMRDGRLAGVRAQWLKPPPPRPLDAQTAVADLLERVSHD